MAIPNRKLFSPISYNGRCTDLYYPPPPPPRSPPSPPPPLHLFHEIDVPNQNQDVSSTILVFCPLGVALLLFAYVAFFKKYYLDSDDSRRTNPPTFDFVLNLPTSHVDTGSLRQSVVGSIPVFKYKRNDGLIEGTECSVYLNEFQEDESLRPLPKCSHAFHIPCIDIWLRSHHNCPLCRAPIVILCNVVNNAHVNEAQPNLNHLGENLENQNGLGGHQVGEEGTNEMGVGTEEGRIGDCSLKVEDESQPVRRPIEGCSSTRLVQEKRPNLDAVAKEVERNSSGQRMMKSSSFGHPFQKGHVAMKRSFSFSGS